MSVHDSKPVMSGGEFLYDRTFGHEGDVRLVLTLDEKVDGERLTRAVEDAAREFPYLKLAVERRSDGLYWVGNPLPFVVLDTADDVPLQSEASNGHSFIALINEEELTLKFSHALMDGRGSMAFFRCILGHYFGCGPAEVRTPDVRETQDMLVEEIPFAEGLAGYSPVDRPAFCVTRDGGLEETERFRHHCFSLDEKEFMGKCKSSDGTPNVAMSVLLCRAIRRFRKDGRMPVINMSADLRAALGNELTHWCTIADMHLPYDERMEGREFTDQCTMMRGRLFLESDALTLRGVAGMMRQRVREAASLPTFEAKEAFYRKYHEETRAHSTALISYVGRFPFGDEINSHIRRSRVFLSAVWAMVQVEITVSHGHFDITWMQKFEDDTIYRLFLDEIRNAGIEIIDNRS